MKFLCCVLVLMAFSLTGSSKPPCSAYEFLYKYEELDANGIKTLKLICLMKCPFGCGYGDCQPDGTCNCKLGATNLRHHKTGEVEFDMCHFQCDHGHCECFESWCYLGSQCVCQLGFSYQEDMDCCMRDAGDPCKGSCQLGTCTIEGDCECKRGYRLMPNFTVKERLYIEELHRETRNMGQIQQQCIPVCKPPCPRNSKCIMPRVCECNDGYHANGQKQCV